MDGHNGGHIKQHWRRFITWTKEIADPELAELSRRMRHQISSQFLVDALMNTVAKRRAGDRADTTREASGRSRRRLLPANLRIVLQTLSISADNLRTVEATLDFALASRRIGSSRLQVPNASATWRNGSRVNRGQIVRKMREKALVNLVRKARALDVLSIVDEVRSVSEALTEMLFSSGFIPELSQSADDFLKSNRFLSKSFACVRSTLKGRTAQRRQS
ncbi:FixJ family two-component response regulator [Paraburkholderia sp. 40]